MTATTLIMVVVLFAGVAAASGSPSLGVIGGYTTVAYLAIQTGDSFFMATFIFSTVAVALAVASFGAKLITGDPAGGG